MSFKLGSCSRCAEVVRYSPLACRSYMHSARHLRSMTKQHKQTCNMRSTAVQHSPLKQPGPSAATRYTTCPFPTCINAWPIKSGMSVCMHAAIRPLRNLDCTSSLRGHTWVCLSTATIHATWSSPIMYPEAVRCTVHSTMARIKSGSLQQHKASRAKQQQQQQSCPAQQCAFHLTGYVPHCALTASQQQCTLGRACG
jgi:hypothetical protein